MRSLVPEILASLDSENQQGPERCSIPQMRKGEPREGQELPNITQQWDSINRTQLWSSASQPSSWDQFPSSTLLLSAHPDLQNMPPPGKPRVYPFLCLVPLRRFSPLFSLRSNCVWKVCDSPSSISSASTGGHSCTLSH